MSGASRKNERWEEKEGETVSVEGHSEAQKLASDPMYRLEHGVQDKSRAEEAAPRIARIIVSSFCTNSVLFYSLVNAAVFTCVHFFQAMNEEKLDDFSINQLTRKKFRVRYNSKSF